MSRRRNRHDRTARHHGPAPGTGTTARTSGPSSGLGKWLRSLAFAGIVVAVVAGAGLVLVDRLSGPPTLDATAIRVDADMGGFDPGSLTVPAGELVRIEFASLDTPYHSDGGGWHQFAIDDLGIDWQVGPKSSQVFSFVAPDQAGTYDFYCDICCGGKENPNMQGTLTVTA